MPDPAMSTDPDRKVKVLYIAGFGRSGSTILDNVLAQVPGFLSVGELRFFWARGYEENRICADGARFRDSGFWRQIVASAVGSAGEHEIDEYARLERQHGNSAGALIRLLMHGDIRNTESVRRYRQWLGRLYLEIKMLSGCHCIIDSSKFPVYGFLLQGVPEIELHVVHLVRDPRAVAYSWMRKKLQPDKGPGEFVVRHNPLKSAMSWNLINRAAEKLANVVGERYHFVRYEDLVSSPRTTIREVLSRVGTDDADCPVDEDGVVQVAPGLAFSGNPGRFRGGTIQLRLDAEWQRCLPGYQYAAITAVNKGMLKQYGYEVRRAVAA